MTTAPRCRYPKNAWAAQDGREPQSLDAHVGPARRCAAAATVLRPTALAGTGAGAASAPACGSAEAAPPPTASGRQSCATLWEGERKYMYGLRTSSARVHACGDARAAVPAAGRHALDRCLMHRLQELCLARSRMRSTCTAHKGFPIPPRLKGCRAERGKRAREAGGPHVYCRKLLTRDV